MKKVLSEADYPGCEVGLRIVRRCRNRFSDPAVRDRGGGRYYFGYSDVLRNGTKYQGNPTHSPLDNINISLAFYYRLSKEGIRSAPSRGVAQRMLEAEEKRASRRMKRNGNDTLPSMGTTTDSLPDMESVTEPQLESESSEIGRPIARMGMTML